MFGSALTVTALPSTTNLTLAMEPPLDMRPSGIRAGRCCETSVDPRAMPVQREGRAGPRWYDTPLIWRGGVESGENGRPRNGDRPRALQAAPLCRGIATDRRARSAFRTRGARGGRPGARGQRQGGALRARRPRRRAARRQRHGQPRAPGARLRHGARPAARRSAAPPARDAASGRSAARVGIRAGNRAQRRQGGLDGLAGEPAARYGRRSVHLGLDRLRSRSLERLDQRRRAPPDAARPARGRRRHQLALRPARALRGGGERGAAAAGRFRRRRASRGLCRRCDAPAGGRAGARGEPARCAARGGEMRQLRYPRSGRRRMGARGVSRRTRPRRGRGSLRRVPRLLRRREAEPRVPSHRGHAAPRGALPDRHHRRPQPRAHRHGAAERAAHRGDGLARSGERGARDQSRVRDARERRHVQPAHRPAPARTRRSAQRHRCSLRLPRQREARIRRRSRRRYFFRRADGLGARDALPGGPRPRGAVGVPHPAARSFARRRQDGCQSGFRSHAADRRGARNRIHDPGAAALRRRALRIGRGGARGRTEDFRSPDGGAREPRRARSGARARSAARIRAACQGEGRSLRVETDLVQSQLPFRRAWRAWLVAALLFSTAAEVTAQETRVPGTEARRIDEPVFGGQMVVYEAGRGNAREILLVHGIGDEAARDFREHIAWLQKSFHVVAVDLPGFGQSDKANVLYSPGNYARILKHVAGRFLRSPFALVGHSMGAVVSLRYTATYPEDVQRLVVIDAPGVLHRYSVTSQYLAHLGLEFVPPAAEPLDWLTNLARKVLAPLEQLHLDPQIILSSPQLRKTLLGADPAKIAGLATVSEDLRQELPKVRAETLVVWGAQDTLAPVRTGRVLALKLPRARLALIERAGHEPMLEE